MGDLTMLENVGGDAVFVKITGDLYLGNCGAVVPKAQAKAFGLSQRRQARRLDQKAKVRVSCNKGESRIVCGYGNGLRYWTGNGWSSSRQSAKVWSSAKYARSVRDDLKA